MEKYKKVIKCISIYPKVTKSFFEVTPCYYKIERYVSEELIGTGLIMMSISMNILFMQ